MRTARAWPLIAACVVFVGGCPNRATVESCGDLRVRNNDIRPYGITVTDCERAEVLAREVAQGREIVVYFDGCTLVGAGPGAFFACERNELGESWAAGDIINPRGIPLRDDERRILGNIWVRGPELIDYQSVLVDGGAAEVWDE